MADQILFDRESVATKADIAELRTAIKVDTDGLT
jgi:hypothetical protein